MKKLMVIIALVGSLIACSTPTTPKFPEITCIPTQKLSDKQLAKLSECKKDMENCDVPRETLMKIFSNYQNKSACLETYQETAKTYK